MGLVGTARRHPDTAAALGLTVIATLVTIIWLWRFRRGGFFNIDEAAYLGGVYDDTTGLQRGGLSGLLRAYGAHSDYAPLVPLSGVPFQLLFGTRLLVPLLALSAWLGVLLVSVAAVTRRLCGRRWSVLAVLAVAGVPGVIDSTRLFHFALPATALLTATVAALLASDRLRRTDWSIATGVLAGLTLLSRSMMVALVPGVLLATGIVVLRSPQRRRSARNLALASVAGLTLAATWYLPNLGSVTGYLTGTGYGADSLEYGVRHAPWEVAWWTARLARVVQHDIGLPIALVIATGLGSLVVLGVRRGRTRMLTFSSPGAHAAIVCTVVVGFGYLSLSTSATPGTEFELPLVPCAVCLALAGIARLRRPSIRAFSAGAVAAVAVVVLTVKSGLATPAVSVWQADVPLVGHVTVLDGRGEIQRYAELFGSGTPGSLEPAAIEQQWLSAAGTLHDRLLAFARGNGRLPVVCFATRDAFMSSNHLGLAARYLDDSPPLPVAQLNPVRGGDSAANYRVRLSLPEEGQPNLLITGDPSPRDFRPAVTQAFAIEAARELGFRPAFTDDLPDGRRLTVWWLLRGPVIPVGGGSG